MRFLATCFIALVIISRFAAGEAYANASSASVANLSASASSVERRENDLALRKEIADTRAAIESGAHDRLEILLAVFGGVITLVVIALAISSRDAAINAAKGAIEAEKSKISETAQEARTEAAEAREQITGMIGELSELKTLLDQQAATMRATIAAEREYMTLQRQELAGITSEIARGREQAQIDLRMIAHMSVTGGLVGDEENQLLLSVINEAEGIDLQHLSENQLNAMTANAALKSLWWEMETYARELDRRFGHHPNTRCASMFFRALAFSKRKHFGPAIELYGQLIDEFASLDEPEFQSRVGRAMFNRARQFQLQQHYDHAISQYDEVAQRCVEAIEDAEIELWVNAQLNKGVCQAKMGNFDGARQSYHAVIRRFPEATGDVARVSVKDAFYNLACSYAREGRVAEANAMLSKWSNLSSDHNIDVLMSDAAFDRIRTEPEFIAWIDENRDEDGDAPLLI